MWGKVNQNRVENVKSWYYWALVSQNLAIPSSDFVIKDFSNSI